MLFIFKWIFNNIFGLSSLIISLYTLWKNRKHLDVYWDDNILRTKPHSIVAIHNGEPGFYENSYLTRLSVINTSPNDIAFFDLRAFNPNTNINFPLVTKKHSSMEKKILKFSILLTAGILGLIFLKKIPVFLKLTLLLNST